MCTFCAHLEKQESSSGYTANTSFQQSGIGKLDLGPPIMGK